MTDKERLTTLLAEFGIEFTGGSDDCDEVVIEAKMGPKNRGYSGFQAVFEFLPDGTFKEVGIWE